MKDSVLIAVILILLLALCWPHLRRPARPPETFHPEIVTDDRVPPESVREWNRRYPDDPITEQTTVLELIDRQRQKTHVPGQP